MRGRRPFTATMAPSSFFFLNDATDNFQKLKEGGENKGGAGWAELRAGKSRYLFPLSTSYDIENLKNLNRYKK